MKIIQNHMKEIKAKANRFMVIKKIFPAITEILKKNFLFLAKNIKIKLILFLVLFLEK